MNTGLWAIGLVLAGCLVGSFGALFFKFAAQDISLSIKSLIGNKYLYLAVFYYAIATAFFIPALKGGELSVLYPIVSTTYIWVGFLSIKFLNEKINFLRWLGVLIIVSGVVLVGLGS